MLKVKRDRDRKRKEGEEGKIHKIHSPIDPSPQKDSSLAPSTRPHTPNIPTPCRYGRHVRPAPARRSDARNIYRLYGRGLARGFSGHRLLAR